MKILLSPTFSDGEKILYKFDGETVEITYLDGSKDTFDFSEVPNGRMDIESIKTDLEINPFTEVKRENGELYLTLLNFIDLDVSEEECFPDWIDHTEYSPPKVGEVDG